MFEQYIIQFVENGKILYLFNHRMSVSCKCYARSFSNEKRAKLYLKQSIFSHFPYETVKK